MDCDPPCNAKKKIRILVPIAPAPITTLIVVLPPRPIVVGGPTHVIPMTSEEAIAQSVQCPPRILSSSDEMDTTDSCFSSSSSDESGEDEAPRQYGERAEV